MIPLTVCVPWSASAEACPHRRVAKAHVVRRVSEYFPGATVVCPTQDSGEWNKPKLVNRAVAEAKTDAVLVLDADVCLPWQEVRTWLDTTFRKGMILQPFSRMVRLPEAVTAEALAGRTFLVSSAWPTVGLFGAAAFLCHREDYLAIGGMDERFSGWGYEDADFGHRARALLHVDHLKGRAWHLYHPRPTEKTSGSQAAARNRELFVRRKRMRVKDAVADTRNDSMATHGQPEPPPVVKGERAVLCACNGPFVRYAAALAHSVLKNSPGWRVHLFATNVPAEALAEYPFTSSRVTIHAETVDFPDVEAERCYMNSRRFLRYREVLENGQVGMAVMLDVDQLVLRSLDRAVKDLGNADMGIIFRPQLEDRNRALMAGTVITRNTPASLRYWHEYETALPPQTWYADQLAMIQAVESMGDDLHVAHLQEVEWCGFEAASPAVVIGTRTEDKLGFHLAKDYARLFGQCETEIAAARQALSARAPHTALVWVCFGADGQRLDAIRKGIADTLESVNRPGLILLLEASATPVLDNALDGISGAVYSHIVPGPRSAGVWQKEAMWEIARMRLRDYQDIRYAVFLDADCTPTVPDYFAQVEALHAGGVKVAQPYRRCTDTVYEDIGGTSCCWRVAFGGQAINSRGAQSGFCWSFDLAWLEECGGFPNVEPLGGGDTMLCYMVFSPLVSWFHGANHMFTMADKRHIERQPCAALDTDLRHHSHGPRGNRQYDLRYRVAMATIKDILGFHRLAESGLMEVAEGPVGDAWLRMLARRNEWTYDMAQVGRIWQECLTTES